MHDHSEAAAARLIELLKNPPREVSRENERDFFTAPELQDLIGPALKNNQLNLRMQEVLIAQAEVSAHRGEYWPRRCGP